MERSDNIQDKIGQRFKELMEKSDSDPNLKKEVMGTIAKIEGAAAFIDLFTVKMAKAEATMFNEISKASFMDNQEEFE